MDGNQPNIPQDGENPMQASADFQTSQIPPDILNLFARGQLAPSNGRYEQNARGAWSQTEDEQLKNAVQLIGNLKWIDIAKFVPTRSSKQCRERWYQRLAPNIKREPFEPWEDNIIIEKQKELGNRWSLIAQQLPGRSPSAVKNRWYSGLKSQHPSAANPMANENEGASMDAASLMGRSQEDIRGDLAHSHNDF